MANKNTLQRRKLNHVKTGKGKPTQTAFGKPNNKRRTRWLGNDHARRVYGRIRGYLP